ncbi:undecaprenyl-diphosphate phosphatase [Candidatus Micrarchaeota archaeon]|nr:undecaprenyl-diphosphate phosphatase [Candidatus Micrarchaeota archaeon]
MVSVLEAVFLGALQGLTEWLPVSSSAHLALAQYFFGIEADVAFDIVLHLGTLLAVIGYYRNDIAALVRGVVGRKEKEMRYAAFIILAAVPTAIIGFAFRDFFEGMFSNPVAIAGALGLTGFFLITANEAAVKKEAKIDAKSSLAIGIAQGLAVAPGISRSGATIGTALFLGIERGEAAKFSFLAGVIPILGAAALEGRKALFGNVELLPVLFGFAVSAIVGYFAIALLIKVLKESKLQVFGYYCLALAAVVLAAVRMGAMAS